MVILSGGEKGGTGKSTIATTLAAMRRKRGFDVLLIDADPQGTSREWAEERSSHADRVSCAVLAGARLHEQIRDFAQRFHDVIIDAGGRDSPELRSALVATDVVITPLKPSWADSRTLDRMEHLIGQARSLNTTLQASVVFTQASTNPLIPELQDAIGLLQEYEGLPYSGVALYERIAYRRAIGLGLCPEEMAEPDPKAVSETVALYSHVFER